MKYVITKVGTKDPVCTLLYMHGVDENQDAVRSSKYPHSELVPMARALGCAILVPSYGSTWLLNADIPPKPPLCWFAGGCSLGPNVDEFLTDLAAVMVKNNMPAKMYAEGVSQGGYNLSNVAMRHPEMFQKILIAHPVMKYLNPFKLESILISMNFSSGKWNEMNPVNGVATAKAMPSTYITTCDADIMVPSDAAKRFYNLGKTKGFDFTLHVDKVGCSHGNFDVTPAISWITK
jgi:predicted esterase